MTAALIRTIHLPLLDTAFLHHETCGAPQYCPNSLDLDSPISPKPADSQTSQSSTSRLLSRGKDSYSKSGLNLSMHDLKEREGKGDEAVGQSGTE